ncbi:sugar transferase [Formosa sp. S-31]|uniref:sugar transferase n=1 Tax=Formosa sp. S-31 TaxID=2790949 RepID=UPI003EB87A7D
MPYKFLFKPFLDFVIAILVIIFLSPILLILTVILFWINKGKPFFIQERPGKNEQVFKIIKFRSMTEEVDKKGKLLPERDRLTKIGKFIRDYSLDEIPQLINVLRGEMSLIGPRPLLIRYLPYYSNEQRKRHDVKPGITGWAQVNGRNTLSWEEKFTHDIWYVENYSFLLDCRILLSTVRTVFSKEGVYNDTQGFVEDFVGS